MSEQIITREQEPGDNKPEADVERNENEPPKVDSNSPEHPEQFQGAERFAKVAPAVVELAAAEGLASGEYADKGVDGNGTGEEGRAAEAVPDEPEKKEKELDPRVESLAIPLARDYAEKNYKKLEDGTFEPAWRGARGEKHYRGEPPEAIADAEGITIEEARAKVVDIANQPYNEFSDYWKEQNRGGAEFLVKLLDERGTDVLIGLDLTDEQVRAEYGSLIHNNWLDRNEWVKDHSYGNPDLAKPFEGLSPEEQQKDIDQLGVLQAWLKA